MDIKNDTQALFSRKDLLTPVFAFGLATALWLPHGLSIAATLAASLLLAEIIRCRKRIDWSFNRTTGLFLALSTFPLITALPHALMDRNEAVLDIPARFLLLVPLVYALQLSHLRVNAKVCSYAIAVGGVITVIIFAVLAFLAHVDMVPFSLSRGHVTHVSLSRTGELFPFVPVMWLTTTHKISYGYLVGAQVVLLFVFHRMGRGSNKLFLLSLALLVFVLLVADVRSAFLSVSLLIFYLFLTKPTWLSFLAVALFTATVVVVVTDSKRVRDDADQLGVFVSAGKPTGCTGSGLCDRLHRWEEAVRLFRIRPVAGWGYEEKYKQHLDWKSSGESFLYHGSDFASTSVHNEILHTLATKGLIGLIGLLSIYLVPIVWLRKQKEQGNYRFLKLSILLFTIYIVSIGLFEAPLYYRHTMPMVYVFSLSLILFLARDVRQKAD